MISFCLWGVYYIRPRKNINVTLRWICGWAGSLCVVKIDSLPGMKKWCQFKTKIDNNRHSDFFLGKISMTYLFTELI